MAGKSILEPKYLTLNPGFTIPSLQWDLAKVPLNSNSSVSSSRGRGFWDKREGGMSSYLEGICNSMGHRVSARERTRLSKLVPSGLWHGSGPQNPLGERLI